MLSKITNYLGLQIGWFACALGAANGQPWIGPLFVAVFLGVTLVTKRDKPRELGFLLVVLLLGFMVDGVKKGTGFLVYASPLPDVRWFPPLWILGMWGLFGSAMRGSLSWLQGKFVLAAVAGAVFGPLSYLAGSRMGAVTFTADTTLTLFVLALVWAIVVAGLAALANRWDG